VSVFQFSIGLWVRRHVIKERTILFADLHAILFLVRFVQVVSAVN